MILSLVRTRTVELFIALRAEGIVVVITVITSSNNATAVQALEAELVIHSAERAEAFSEENGLVTGRANGIIAGGVNHNLFNLTLSVHRDLATDEVGTLEIIQISRISGDRENANADLLEVLQFVQITHTEKIHFRTTNTSSKSNETTDVFSLEENRSLINLLINSKQKSNSLNAIGNDLVCQVAKNDAVLKSGLELILVIRVLLAHNFLHPFSCDLDDQIRIISINTIQWSDILHNTHYTIKN